MSFWNLFRENNTAGLTDGHARGPSRPEPKPIYMPTPDIDPEAPTPAHPDYYRMRDIRNGERRNGEPLSWAEIREKIAREKEVRAKWGGS
jgi:hypothetical protein